MIDLQRDSRDRAGEALVHYLTQSGADSAACTPYSKSLPRFTSQDFERFVRGLERGDVPPSSWTACEQRLIVGLTGPLLKDAIAKLAVRFAKNLDVSDDDPRRLLVVNALAVAIDTRPSGSTAPDEVVAMIGDALASRELGSQARAIAAYLYEGLQMSRGLHDGAIVSEELLAMVTDTRVLRRLARHLPTEATRRAARVRFVELTIAASTSNWVRAHAEETRARLLDTGRNALDVATFPIASANYEGPAPDGTVIIEQNVGAQSARVLMRLADETSLVPPLALRQNLHFTSVGIDSSITLCGPADALDVAPCVDSAAVDVASPSAALDHDGVLHMRDQLSASELGAVLAGGERLAVPLTLGTMPLAELRWPLRVLPPDSILYERGEKLSATVEQFGSRVAVSFGGSDGERSLAFVEMSDLSVFSVTTRGAQGRTGSQGTTGFAGMSGSSGSSAMCPSSPGGRGGSGSRGGRGGDGGPGGPGGDGGDVEITLVCDTNCAELERIARELVRTEGGHGGVGGKGGDGGRGGSGGQGGAGTSCRESSFGSASSSHSTYLSAGSSGDDGEKGWPGSDGRPGAPGRAGRVRVNVLQRAAPR